MENQVTIEQIVPLIFALSAVSVLFLLGAFFLWRRNQQDRRASRPSAGGRQLPPAPQSSQPAPGVLARIWHFFFYTEEEKATMEAKRTRPASSTPLPAGARGAATSRPASAPPDAVEVMRLWRDVTDGTLIVQIGDQSFRSLAEIRVAGHERRFMAALRELTIIARAVPAEAPPTPEPSPALVEQPAPPAAQPTPSVKIPPAPPVAPPIDLITDTTPPAEPIGSFFDNVRKLVQSGGRVPAGAPVPLSIPEQIDAVLQQMLLRTPEFTGRRIHIRQSVAGGVLIEVDDNSYEAVADIADDAVRAFVQEAIREWELRS
ncbi:MAG: hypothetical protein HPY64_04835 [Anaerolineae bacterium]|nr:hypothetical protein [Anaerolineae bacterium]